MEYFRCSVCASAYRTRLARLLSIINTQIHGRIWKETACFIAASKECIILAFIKFRLKSSGSIPRGKRLHSAFLSIIPFPCNKFVVIIIGLHRLSMSTFGFDGNKTVIGLWYGSTGLFVVLFLE